jgi:hypothetical protein
MFSELARIAVPSVVLLKQRAQDDGRGNHRELVIGQHEAADPQHALTERRLDLEVVGAPDHADDGAQEIAKPDGRHDDGELRIAEDRTHHHALGQHAEQRHRRHSTCKTDPVIEAQNADEGEGEEPAQHHQVALGEVHHLGRLVDQHKAERDQAVNAAERNPADQLLNEVQHPPSPDARRFLKTAFCSIFGCAEKPHFVRR